MSLILYIDDDFPQFGKILEISAKENGFTIIGATSVEAGLSVLKEKHDDICSVILDIAFPSGKDGKIGLGEIKLLDEHLPVIMLTGGSSDTDNIIECMEKGANGFVDKNKFDPVRLFERIKNISDGYTYKKNDIARQALREEFRGREYLYDKMIQAVQMITKNILGSKLMFSPAYESRVKTFKSFYDKKTNKETAGGKIKEPFTRFADIAGLRVIFYNAADMEQAVKLLQASDDFVDAKTGDGIVPDDKVKEYGYRAVHFDIKLNPAKRGNLQEYQMLLDIPCEIQLKTIFAHSWSKVYHALSYKEIGSVSLSPEKKNALAEDFRTAAIKLEDIEKQITDLSERYFNEAGNSANTP